MNSTPPDQRNAAGFDRDKGHDVKSLLHLARFLKPYRWAMVGAFTALMIAAVTVLALGVGLRRLVDEGFSAGNPALLDQALIVLLVVIILLAVATYSRFFLVSWIGERMIADIRKAVFDRVVGFSPSFFEVTLTGEVLSRLTTDTTLLQTVIGSSASIAMRNALMLTGGLIMLSVTSPQLTGLVLLVVPVVVAPIIFFGRRVRRLSRASQDRIADIGAYGDEVLNGIQTVQAFCHEEIDRMSFAGKVEDAFLTATRRIRQRAFLTAMVIMLVFGAVGLILWKGGHDVLSGVVSPGELSAFIFYSVVVAGATGALSEVFGDLQRAAGATDRLMELLEIEPQISAPANPKPLPQPASGNVEFENVTFRYPTRPDAVALENFSLSLPAGETLALVGPSGAGKSTVFQLLLRFYDPQEGHVCLDGVDVKDLDPTELRGRTGLVPQAPVIFAASAWDNIRYGRPGASDDEVREAAEAAAASHFLDKLPDGFDTFLGERGVLLSGGERQRIAIARAILRNPAVLLLDEATSALDAENEHLVQEALDRLMKGRTTIVIAHRLATVIDAGRIVVMDEGSIVATGSHARLQEENELYARLAALQFGPEAERVH